MKTSEIFVQQSIKQIGSLNQWVVTSRHNQTTIINAYSFDQFHPYRLVPEHHRRQCKEFQLRHHYALPNTPKIILVNKKQKQNQQLLLLVQRGQFQFSKFILHYENDQKSQIQLALQIVSTVQMLQKKYGYFKLTQSMIRASKGPSLLLWISQNQVNNQPQFPIGPFYQINLQNRKMSGQNKRNPMEIMIRSIFQLLTKAFKNNKIITDILKAQQKLLTFDVVKTILNQGIKEQIASYSNIPTQFCEKNRRNTQQKKRKIPQFLLNKSSLKVRDPESTKTMEYSMNKITYVEPKPITKNQKSKFALVKKIGYAKHFQTKRYQNEDQKLNSMLANASIKTKDTRENQNIVSKQSIKYQQEVLRFRKPYLTVHQQARNELLPKKQKPIIVRESNKSVSTSCAQYFSINSSGKKMVLHSMSTQDQYPSNIVKKKQNVKIARSSQKNQQPKYSSFYHEHIKSPMNVSKITEQNNEENHLQSQPQSTRTQRAPSILVGLTNNNTIYQKSINSPGSQFFKDVDNLLYSGAISRQVESELDKSMEGELHRILFD